MDTTRRIAAVMAVALAAVTGMWRARAAEPVPTTLYLHSLTPAGAAEGALPFAGLEGGPYMDATPPILPVSKVVSPSAGNEAFRMNPLLSWWRAPLHGVVTSGVVRLYVTTGADGWVSVTVFGDGRAGAGEAAGGARVEVDAAVPTLVTIPIPDLQGHIENEIVLQVSIGVSGGSISYDSTVHPSSFSFLLSDYVPPPPIAVPDPAAGWDRTSVVSTIEANREASIAINPVDEDVQLICSPSGVPNIDPGQSFFHITTDRGATWRSLDVETSDDDPRTKAFEGGDCDVAFDAVGTMYSADTWAGNLSVGHSTDGGATWSGTSMAGTSPVVDRPWLVGGPAGVVHVTYQDLQCCTPSAVWYTRSDDYGNTFRPAVPVTFADPVDGAFTWQGNFVVSADGDDVYLIYTRRTGPTATDPDSSGPETVWVAASHDGGLTWASHLIAAMPNPASYLYPAIAIDSAGWLHAVWSSRTAADRPVWYSFSKDGVSWREPVPLSEGVGTFAPWVAAGGPGDAAVIWYGSTSPLAGTQDEADWYMYAARVTGADGSMQVTYGPTTASPLYHGKTTMPEFNQVRLDSGGKMHIGAAAFRGSVEAGNWTIYYQREI